MPLSTDDYLLTYVVAEGVVNTEPVAVAIRTIVRAAPSPDSPDWSVLGISLGGTSIVQEVVVATPWADLVPVARG